MGNRCSQLQAYCNWQIWCLGQIAKVVSTVGLLAKETGINKTRYDTLQNTIAHGAEVSGTCIGHR